MSPKLSDINADRTKVTTAHYSVTLLGSDPWKYTTTNGATATVRFVVLSSKRIMRQVTCKDNYRVMGDLGRSTLTYTCDVSTPIWNSNGETCTKGLFDQSKCSESIVTVCAAAVAGDLGNNSVLGTIEYYESDGVTPETIDGGMYMDGTLAKVC